MSSFLWHYGLQHVSSLVLHSFQEFVQIHVIESVMLYNHLNLCCPLLLPSTFASIRVFSNILALPIRWSEYWNFSISSSNEYSGLIFFRIDWFDLLAAQGALKHFLQHYNSQTSIYTKYVSCIIVSIPWVKILKEVVTIPSLHFYSNFARSVVCNNT